MRVVRLNLITVWIELGIPNRVIRFVLLRNVSDSNQMKWYVAIPWKNNGFDVPYKYALIIGTMPDNGIVALKKALI